MSTKILSEEMRANLLDENREEIKRLGFDEDEISDSTLMLLDCKRATKIKYDPSKVYDTGFSYTVSRSDWEKSCKELMNAHIEVLNKKKAKEDE